MGTRTDGVLALIALAAFVGLAVLADVALSPLLLLIGGLATIVFELLAARAYDTVRQYWERRSVQVTSLAAAIGSAAIGTRIAPVPVLSLCCGVTITYLGFLSLVRTGIVPPPRTWW